MKLLVATIQREPATVHALPAAGSTAPARPTVAEDELARRIRRYLWGASTVAFVLALLVRIAFVKQFPSAVDYDLLWNDSVGWNLAQGHGFTASLTEPRLPGIFRSPGYPAFLALIYSVSGHSIFAALYAQAVLDALSSVLLIWLGSNYFAPRVAALAGVLYALYPYAAYYCGFLSQDILLTFSVLLFLLLSSRALRGGSAAAWWAAAGTALAAAAYVKPFAVLFIVIPLAALLQEPRPVFRKMQATAVLATTAAMLLLPWVVRNYLAFGSFPPLSVGSTGGNLLLVIDEIKGGEDYMIQKNIRVQEGVKVSHAARARDNTNDPAMALKDPEHTKAYLSHLLDGQQLIDIERDNTTQFRREIKGLWPQYIIVILRHVPRLWITTRAIGQSRWVALVGQLMSWLVLLGGGCGIWLLRHRWRELTLLLATVIGITLFYAPYDSEARYTLPARPIMLLFLAAALAIGWDAVRAKTAGRIPGTLAE